MTKLVRGGSSGNGLNRRTLLQAAVGAMAMPAMTRSAFAQEKLAGSGEVVAFSFGGSFTEGYRKYVLDPFTKATGIKVVDVTADFAEPQLKAMHAAGRVEWDIASVQGQAFPEMSQAGMFEPIDYNLWDDESLKGSPDSARLNDGVRAFQSCQVLTYDERVFRDKGPKSWPDFWDVKTFAGPRGLYAPSAKFTLEFALLADGVARSDVWPLTDDKVDRALKKLDQIKPHVAKWWTAGGESPQLLINREYVMTSGFDNRTILAIRGQKAPIRMVWDAGAHVNYSYWVVPKGGSNSKNAQKLIAFINRAEIAAGLTLGTGAPGANKNQLRYLPSDLTPLLSISPENADKLVVEDSAWLAAKRPDGKTNLDHVQARWLAWRAQ